MSESRCRTSFKPGAICRAIPALLAVITFPAGCAEPTHLPHPLMEGVECFSSNIVKVGIRTANDVQVARLLRLGDRIIAPVVVRSLPRLFATGVRQQLRPEKVIQFVGTGQMYIHLPMDQRITGYLFLVRSPGGSEWRVLELAAETLSPMPDAITFPELGGLETLASREDQATLLGLLGKAQEARSAMSHEEK